MSDPFRDFMHPDVVWIDEPDYVRVFRELTGEAPMPGEAAWTQPNTNYPGFVNVSRSETPGHLRIIVRTAHQSNVSHLDIPIEAWDQFVADAAMVRQAGLDRLAEHVGQGFTGRAPTPYPGEIDKDETRAYDGQPYPTSRDPLMQRTDPSLPDDHPDNEGYWIRIADDKHAAQMADLEPEADRHGASAGDPLGQRGAAADDGGAPADVGGGSAAGGVDGAGAGGDAGGGGGTD